MFHQPTEHKSPYCNVGRRPASLVSPASQGREDTRRPYAPVARYIRRGTGMCWILLGGSLKAACEPHVGRDNREVICAVGDHQAD